MPVVAIALLLTLGLTLFLMLVAHLATTDKAMRNRPAEQQERLRWLFHKIILLVPMTTLVGYFSHLERHAAHLLPPYLLLLVYIASWLAALWLLWRSYRLGLLQDDALIHSWNGKVLRHTETLTGRYALLHLALALGLIAVLIVAPMLHLRLYQWLGIFPLGILTYLLAAQQINRPQEQ